MFHHVNLTINNSLIQLHIKLNSASINPPRNNTFHFNRVHQSIKQNWKKGGLRMNMQIRNIIIILNGQVMTQFANDLLFINN